MTQKIWISKFKGITECPAQQKKTGPHSKTQHHGISETGGKEEILMLPEIKNKLYMKAQESEFFKSNNWKTEGFGKMPPNSEGKRFPI